MNAKKSHETDDLNSLLDKAWNVSRREHGNRLTVFVPGMFVVDGRRGKYQAVSITGDRCDLDCEHCRGTLLRTMCHATDCKSLERFGLDAWARGECGILVTGGCDSAGRLPWRDFLPAIRKLTGTTGLIVTVHAGQVDKSEAVALKEAGVRQALVDVIGDDDTARDVYHLAEGTAAIRRTLESLASAGLETVPHILYGINRGREIGEYSALETLKSFPMKKYVIVVLMPTSGTPMAQVVPPPPESVARFMAEARLALPGVRASLGCARPRGRYRRRLDPLAVRAGANSMAIPSDQALDEAENRGLEVVFKQTCCSLD